jgi:hypothetical protein
MTWYHPSLWMGVSICACLCLHISIHMLVCTYSGELFISMYVCILLYTVKCIFMHVYAKCMCMLMCVCVCVYTSVCVHVTVCTMYARNCSKFLDTALHPSYRLLTTILRTLLFINAIRPYRSLRERWVSAQPSAMHIWLHLIAAWKVTHVSTLWIASLQQVYPIRGPGFETEGGERQMIITGHAATITSEPTVSELVPSVGIPTWNTVTRRYDCRTSGQILVSGCIWVCICCVCGVWYCRKAKMNLSV